jgi:glycosyltransferase involved in cell wall biosynthesis
MILLNAGEKMKQLKILHIASTELLRTTGLQYSVPSLISAQNEICESQLIINTKQDISAFGKRNFLYKNIAALVQDPAEIFRSPFNRPSIAVFHGVFHPAYVRLGKILHSSGVPYVIVPRGSFMKDALKRKFLKKWLGMHLYFNGFYKHCSAFHFLSEEEAKNSINWGRPYFIVNNGIDQVRRPFLSKPGSKSHLTFGYIGRIDLYHKGLDLLIKACFSCRDSIRKHKARFMIYGNDHHGDKARLIALINHYSLGDFIEVKDPVVDNAKHLAFRTFDVFLHTSRHEGQPITVLEAWAHGLPCLLTPGTNLMFHLLKHNVGWLCQENPSSISMEIIKIINSKNKLKKFSNNSLKLSKFFNWENIAKESIKQYMKILI